MKAADAELAAAEADLQRFEALLRSNAGSRKQRDDAATRRDVAAARVQRARSTRERRAKRLRGCAPAPRPQEIAGARARVAAVDAQIASLQKTIADAVVKSPVGGIVTSKLIDAGEMVAPRTALVVITDLDHAWANVYVDEPLVPQLQTRAAARAHHRRRPAPERHDHVHLAESGVHAAQRADRRRALEAGVPHQGDGRQPRRRAEAGHAGRSGAAAVAAATMACDSASTA